MSKEQIIVTIIDKATGKLVDVEVPVKVACEKLIIDIALAINGYMPEMNWDMTRIALFCPRQNKKLEANKTFYDEGIWNGDYLFIVSK